MDKISADLLDRIRTAVIKKLREMERYVDNELPDYIMILVANKRTLAHMQKDLSLFLGKHTTDFTFWLFNMIAYLKKSSPSVTSALKSKENIEKSKSEEDADVLDYDLGDQEADLLDQDEISMSNKPSVSGNSLKSKVPGVTGHSEDAIIALSRQHTTQKSAKVYPVQPVCRLHTKPNIISEQQPTFQPSFPDEYDPTKPEFSSSVSSVVHNTRKSYPKPPALQTNKLLLRAVDDATKSVMDSKNLNRYKPTPIKVLASTKPENVGSRPQNLVSVKIDPSFNLVTNPVLNFLEVSTIDINEQESEMSVFERNNHDFSGSDNNNRTICLSSEPSEMEIDVPFPVNEYSTVDEALFPISELVSHESESAVNVQQKEEQTTPHFIVTLDGVDFSSFKRKFSESEESMDAEDGFLVDEGLDTSQKRPKVVEKCKYWPSCKNSEDCVYYHPSVPCKHFPDCRYGDKCLFIHPNCKFDARCSKKDCPYTHAMKKMPLPFVANKRPVKVNSFKTVCKFYPKCTVKNCAFIHPKLCRFGTKCRLPTCLFTHVSIPPRNQMKWKANVSENV